ncbi:MAG: RNA polymerase sigma factor [Acidimicrobiales bacterium]
MPRSGRGGRDRINQRTVRDGLRQAAGDREALAAVLDPLALEAASGSPDAVELVVWAVDELGLARPAIRQLLVDERDVEEVGQDVLVAVAETLHGFRGDARFTTWLHQVARFKAIAFLRRRRSTEPLPGDDPVGDAQRISSMIATRTSISEVLAALPPDYREPVVLRDVQQLSYDQLAERLGLNLNTAKSRVARGRALVAARLRTG